ncbi:MAG: SDR family NAD(P)-dependent oxidoreductase [Acidimicrobiia bacterium]
MALTVNLTGRVALVTAGGAGIGHGIALELARCGADVAVVDIDRDRAEATATSFRTMGVCSRAVVAEVMETDQVRSAVAEVDRELGRLDILVNNAGGVAGRAVPIMIRGGEGGSIINIASIEDGPGAGRQGG